MKIYFVRFSDSVIIPTKGAEVSADFDLCCVKLLLYLQIL